MACARKKPVDLAAILPNHSIQPPSATIGVAHVPARNAGSYLFPTEDGRVGAVVKYSPTLSWRFRLDPRLEVLEERPDGTLEVAFGPELAPIVAAVLGARPKLPTRDESLPAFLDRKADRARVKLIGPGDAPPRKHRVTSRVAYYPPPEPEPEPTAAAAAMAALFVDVA
jgi:hypothetical protein